MMLLAFYRWFLHWAAQPLARFLLRQRSRRSADYLLHWDERFGQALPNAVQGAIWIHAVSVGETRAAVPLVAALRRHFPDAPLLITQMTPTGRATAQSLFPDAQCRYLPYDRADWVAAFLAQHRPMLGVVMETEIWPNLMLAAQTAGVPMVLANARLSAKSAAAYGRWPSLFRPAFAAFDAVLAQSGDDAARLSALGARHVQVCGNTKYDIAPDAAMTELATDFKRRIGNRPVVVCGSTRHHAGVDEEALLLAAWQKQASNALLVLIPRHPERFDSVEKLAQSMGFKTQRRSDNLPVLPDTQVWLGDSMGEMFAYYACADVAFVGGSLVDTGCQNIIEPIACGVPTLFGWSVYNFAQVSRDALAASAALQVASADEWQTTVSAWLADTALRATYRERTLAFVQTHRGAADKMAQCMLAVLRR